MSHPVIINKYQVVEPLGHGAFGQVYRVIDRALQTEKAIKILGITDPTKFLASLEEAQILNKCRHKHIVTINEANIFHVDGNARVILDLEYIPEGSLEGALQSRWVSIKESVQYLRGALQGLEHAHAQGILHRDIKPGNILLGNTGAKLSDFGLATETAVDLIGSAKGYTTHLPPEYFTARVTNIQSDVFAAGITLFRALSNISQWHPIVHAIPNLRAKIESGNLIGQIGFESFIPKRLNNIIRKACAVDPSKRYATAQEFRQKLDGLRFGVDWIALSDFHWEGFAGNDTYSIEVDPHSFSLSFKKNGRRTVAKCKTFPSLSEAISSMHTEVANTTLL